MLNTEENCELTYDISKVTTRLELVISDIKALPSSRESSIAITHAETSLLWLKSYMERVNAMD